MLYDTHTIEQCEREIAYCRQEIARTTSKDRRRKHETKLAKLQDALERKRRAAGLAPRAADGAIEAVITAGGMRVYDEHGTDFAEFPNSKLTPALVMKVIGAVRLGSRGVVERLTR